MIKQMPKHEVAKPKKRTYKWKNAGAEKVNGEYVHTRGYEAWLAVRRRCSDAVAKVRPASRQCTYSEDWKSYDNFFAWASQQVGFASTDLKGRLWELDKDLLLHGNRHYSAETCVFIPSEINLFISRKNSERSLPVGVHYTRSKLKYTALCRGKYLGVYSTIEDAFTAYKTTRENHAKVLAAKYVGIIDQRAVDALNNYTVNIDD